MTTGLSAKPAPRSMVQPMDWLLGLVPLGVGILLFIGANLVALAFMMGGGADETVHEPRR